MKVLTTKIDGLVAKVDAGQALNKDDEQTLAALLADGSEDEKQQKAVEYKQNTAKFEEQDFEKMSNTQLATAIMKRIGQEFAAQRDHFDGRLEHSQVQKVDADIRTEVKEARVKYKQEFEDNYDATMTIATRNPSLSIEDAFLLAKARDTRGELSKLREEKEKGIAAAANVSLPDSVTDTALVETVKGKSVQETAEAIAARIGLQ